MIPNYLADVEQAKRDYPEAWAQAHTGGPRTEEFIRLLAARLHAKDARFGLNGKRGNPADISDDVLNFKGEGPGHDPTDGHRPITVIDVIAAAGSPEARPVWQVFSDLPGPGAWVQPALLPAPAPMPVPPPAPAPTPTPAPVPAPVCTCDLAPLVERLDALAQAVAQLRPVAPEPPVYPVYEGKAWGVVLRLRPVGPAKEGR